MSPDEILASLDPEQRKIAQNIGKPLRVLAGAGTGKTRAMTHRIAYAVFSGQYRPQNILAVTFTTKAAAEMATRLEKLGVYGVQARTFHSAALRQVQHFWAEVFGGSPYRVIQNKVPLVGQACTEQGLIATKDLVKEISAEIDWAKVNMLTAEQYREQDRKIDIPQLDQEIIAKIYERFEYLKRAQGVIDLEDVLLLCSAMIEKNDKVAAQIRAQYKHFVVDEYQDVSPLQHAVLKSWLGKRQDLCVVGDPSQTIYSFSGARQDFLMNFHHEFPEATTELLIRNYRSTPEIIALANKVLLSSKRQQPLQLVSQQDTGPEVKFVQYDSDEAEATGITREVKSLIEAGTQAQDIAILFRTNFQSMMFEQTLGEYGISYQLYGQQRYFSRAEVRQAIALLQKNKQLKYTGSVSSVVVELFEKLDFDPAHRPQESAEALKWENLSAIVSLSHSWDQEHPAGTLSQFVESLLQRAKKHHAPVVNAVTLASFHSTKGLEFRHVFLSGIREGLVPITHAVTIDQIEEERRLFYVAITRAMETLQISWSTQTKKGNNQGKSRFLLNIDETQIHIEAKLQTPLQEENRTPLTCKNCGQELIRPSEIIHGRCDTCPPADIDAFVFQRLDQWRMHKAKELKIPTVKVLSKREMFELAEVLPHTKAELAACTTVSSQALKAFSTELLSCINDAELQ
ncbi:MAG: ATP-dependent DNA helicase UvrD2 [Micrococcaceae bacterium]